MVFPAPCKPAIKITLGGVSFSFNGEFSFPIIFINSVLTTSINFCPGLTPLTTSSPIALSFTSETNSLTTDKLTSASNNAFLTCFKASSILFSLIFASPLKPFTASSKREESSSNIIYTYICSYYK